MNIGQAIKLCRTRRGISQTDLARKAECSVSYLSMLENNKRDPTLSTINSIASALNIPVSIIFFIAAEAGDLNGIDKGLGENLRVLRWSCLMIHTPSDSPFYSKRRISSMTALSKALNISPIELLNLANRADHMYRLASTITKPDGSTRQTWDAYAPLKKYNAISGAIFLITLCIQHI